MGKIWQAGDKVSFVELNELQAKADAYDELMAEKEVEDSKDEESKTKK